MDELNLTTPTLLFSAVSLILLAYTNRFLSYAQLVRTLQTPLSDTQHAGTGYLKSVFLRCRHVSDLHRSARPVGIYLRTGSPAAHRFLGNIHLGNPYFRQGT